MSLHGCFARAAKVAWTLLPHFLWLFLLSTSVAHAATSSKPEQAAPKPTRLADGRPNWTGFWTAVGGLLDRNFGPGYVPPAQSAPRPALTHSPMKSPYKERYEELVEATKRGVVIADPAAQCNPISMPRMMNMTYGMELLQTPGQIAITSEYGPATRRVWLDGRAHPPEDELDPTFAGHSIGQWQGDTLVVDTTGIRVESPIDQSGLVHSEKLHLIERFTSPQPGILQDEITIIDPDVFTAPWKIVKRYGYRPDLSIQEYSCFENNRNVGDRGQPKFP